MKLRFLQPTNCGIRQFAPGDIAYLPDAEALQLLEVNAAEPVELQRNKPIRVSINLADQVEL